MSPKFQTYKIVEIDASEIKTGDVLYVRYPDTPEHGCFAVVGEKKEGSFLPFDKTFKSNRLEELEEALALAEEKAGTSD